MTDQQIVQFILHRAKTNGKVNFVNPRLVLWNNMSSLLLGIKSDNHSSVFLLRFLKDQSRGIFKFKLNDSAFTEWKCRLVKDYGKAFVIDYDLETVPDSVKHYVSYAVIEALKTKGMGFDLFSISCTDDPVIVSPNETYEEVAIETDLMDFGFDTMLL